MNLLKPSFGKRILFFLISDILIFFVSLYLAYQFRFDFNIPTEYMESFWSLFIILASLKLVAFATLRIYYVSWRFFGLYDAKRIVKAHLIALGAFLVFYFVWHDFFMPMPRSVIIIDFFLSLSLVGLLRISKRIFLERTHIVDAKRTVVFGANVRTNQLIQSYLNGETEYYPSAIIDDASHLTDTYFHNVRVYASKDLEQVVDRFDIDSAVFADSLEQEELQQVVDRLAAVDVHEIKRYTLLGDRNDFKDIAIEDLLARHPKDLDKATIAGFVTGKTILVTGAGGSIGSELVRQCIDFDAKQVILIDHSEYNLYQVVEKSAGADTVAVMLSVTEGERLPAIFDRYRPDVVFHAAAYKHVPLCEANKAMAVKNNILGTKNVIDCAIASGVDKVVVISTDKAVRPTNVMGATKRVTELYAQNVNAGGTEIVSVRFGNVLGSSGSVIPKFKAQIEAGGPITVTHPDITRYFMLIPEACQLVLQAGAMAKGGELFVLDMGEPVKIVDLAKRMLRLSGKEDEIEIEFCGLRPGEKLYEELLISEDEEKTKYESIYIAHPTPYDIEQLNSDIEALIAADDKVSGLKKIVPEFDHRP
jgi:UDP-N-acetyl-D-glucosamine 4,6-dehydratase